MKKTGQPRERHASIYRSSVTLTTIRSATSNTEGNGDRKISPGGNLFFSLKPLQHFPFFCFCMISCLGPRGVFAWVSLVWSFSKHQGTNSRLRFFLTLAS